MINQFNKQIPKNLVRLIKNLVYWNRKYNNYKKCNK